MMNMDDENSGGQDFDMCSFIEDHMSKEDLLLFLFSFVAILLRT